VRLVLKRPRGELRPARRGSLATSRLSASNPGVIREQSGDVRVGSGPRLLRRDESLQLFRPIENDLNLRSGRHAGCGALSGSDDAEESRAVARDVVRCQKIPRSPSRSD
jgi:hypothetical protein